ncbi:hypothetical protein pdam_00016685 [Pocillopora damicornis]|uniref:F-box domain-containing protein n=1 Tax=Pocillopora damicornis TaxID=46731 RepID=A0A3M6V599_POCDA|nr:uncharacterized protein LOC113684924 [Pocillopora damicornis]XP_027058144.1 uncharacterized protein LOC113684924 [Pocillopora damicornis]XP_027058146.1 uncharacterized protein LOC113684924 [Pocillopora damicornis]RMX61143.1 hypothetical protein pdam_00016685 [Pocillopora damicornis]
MKSPLTPRTLEIFYQNNGGNGLLDLLAPEVFYQIMVNLELKDIRICMCVCKKWRLLLSTGYFWRNYMNHSFDFTDQDEERLTGMLHELGSSWFFGWGQGMVQGLPDGDLFEELPRRWKSGIVHPVGPDVRSKVPDYKAMYESLHQLQKLQDEVNEREIVYTGSSENSGECPVDMLLFPWEHDKLPSQEEVMEIFHLNTNLRLDVTYERSEKSFAEGKELERIFKCRRKLPSESIFYEALPKVLDDGFIKVHVDYQGRSNTFRPCPVFILTQLSPGWCGGVLTGVW